mmetsp:Transcript_2950/g.7942  ORF Transcript_2950/g.7942 Transcript_2950/m.7942 type:complete len:239 (-) Transcript_2950:81-797(-)
MSWSATRNNAGTCALSAHLTRSRSLGLKPAVPLMELATMAMNGDAMQPGTKHPSPISLWLWVSTMEAATVSKRENGESSTTALTSGRSRVLSVYNSVVTAPMERPQTAIDPTLQLLRRYSMTAWRSSCSYHPSETCSPSDMPEPAKSKANTEHPSSSAQPRTSCASRRLPALAWQYTTQGALSVLGPEQLHVLPPAASARCQWEHSSTSPRGFVSPKSVRVKATPPYAKDSGPRSLRL